MTAPIPWLPRSWTPDLWNVLPGAQVARAVPHCTPCERARSAATTGKDAWRFRVEAAQLGQFFWLTGAEVVFAESTGVRVVVGVCRVVRAWGSVGASNAAQREEDSHWTRETSLSHGSRPPILLVVHVHCSARHVLQIAAVPILHHPIVRADLDQAAGRQVSVWQEA